MWVFTNTGFVSIVQHREQVDLMIVRARRAAHLQSLFPGAEVLETKNADYRFRTFIHRGRVKDALAAAVDALDYPNFKNSIADASYHDAASAVWNVMYQLPPSSQPPLLGCDLFDPPYI
jgi:hypothetical protein